MSDFGFSYGLSTRVISASSLAPSRTLLFDFDPAQASTITLSGALVESWADSAGKIGAQTAAGTARPTWGAATGASGKPGVTFNGTTNVTVGPCPAAVSGNDKPFSLYAVVSFAALNATSTFFGLTNPIDGVHYHWLYVATNAWRSQRSESAANTVTGSASAVAATNYVIRAFFSGTRIVMRANNAEVISDTAQDIASLALTNMSLGALKPLSGSGTVGYSAITYSRIFAYDGRPSTAEDATIANYLLGAYGIGNS
jgi:hypothetical protein